MLRLQSNEIISHDFERDLYKFIKYLVKSKTELKDKISTKLFD